MKFRWPAKKITINLFIHHFFIILIYKLKNYNTNQKYLLIELVVLCFFKAINFKKEEGFSFREFFCFCFYAINIKISRVSIRFHVLVN